MGLKRGWSMSMLFVARCRSSAAIYKDVEKSHPKARRKLKFNETIRQNL